MDFLKGKKRISFLYGGKPYEESLISENFEQSGNTLTTVYELSGGLKLTNIATYYEKYNAFDWVNYLENTGTANTPVISELWDCCFDVPMVPTVPRPWSADLPEDGEGTKIYSPAGSDWMEDEFHCEIDLLKENYYHNWFFSGEVRRYANRGGRSSQGTAPFFNVYYKNKGFIAAVGWTGQWNAELIRNNDSVTFKSKIEDTEFYLLPGEKIRTSSVTIMCYEGGFDDSQNLWRRFVKEIYCPIGKGQRPKSAPFCQGIWGGMSTKGALERINGIVSADVPNDHFWMDAGWYGMGKLPSPNEYEGDWGFHTGDWRINPNYHPDELRDVVKAMDDSGRGYLLWFEPERVRSDTPIYSEHPEYFLTSGNPDDINTLLDLGNDEAWQYCFDTISELIERLHVKWYRQDFNFEPLYYWRRKDTEGRKGITEIKHIMGMYRYWDALLEKFPYLLIDNCASGGKRIDIETLRRSVPLWRSDVQCPSNFPAEYTQSHAIGYGRWLPYSGTGTGWSWGDEYSIRSGYSPGFVMRFSWDESDEFGSAEQMAWIKKYADEYVLVKPYLSEDIYPLTKQSGADDVWIAVQYNAPEKGDGVIQLFRRKNSPYATACFELHGIDKNADYIFTDADDNSKTEISGSELIENGLSITVNEKRKAKIIFYFKKEQ